LIVRPETVLRWHRKGWRLYWTSRSRGRIARPRLPAEVKDLIAQISRDNRLWGTERIRGELLKLGIVVSNRSIRRYRWRKPRPEGSQAWRTFLRNHLNGIWAADLFVGVTLITMDTRSAGGLETESAPDPGERQTRLSGAWTALIVGIVALVVILVFVLQNLQNVRVKFLIFDGELPLAIALLSAMILGAIIVLAFGGGRILQLRMVARRARLRRVKASPPVA
jgi:uncharacterized integral membrane protein